MKRVLFMGLLSVGLLSANAKLVNGSLFVQPFCSGNKFLEYSDTKKYGYVMGVLDMAIEVPNLLPKLNPALASIQLADHMTKYLKDNPDKRQYTCASTLTLILRTKYAATIDK